MKTVLLIFITIVVCSIYEDVHALRLKFAPPLPDVDAPYTEAHPQPAHKPDAR